MKLKVAEEGVQILGSRCYDCSYDYGYGCSDWHYNDDSDNHNDKKNNICSCCCFCDCYSYNDAGDVGCHHRYGPSCYYCCAKKLSEDQAHATQEAQETAGQGKVDACMGS